MNKIWLSTGVLGVIALAIAGITWQTTHKALSPEESQLETCKSLSYNDPNGINLLFFASKSDAQKYSDYLLDRKPFDTNSKKFNVYYIDDYSPPCKLYRSIALLCDSRELTEKAASCPHDYIFVLRKEDVKIRSSAYNLVNSINTAHPLTVIQHEFGHTLANLAEEYTPADLPSGQPNCKESCEEFGEYSSSCFTECSDSTHKRSIDKGVMRTLDSDRYGNYNEKILFNIINKLVPESKATGFAVQDSFGCGDEKQIIVSGHYSEGIPVLDSATQAHGCAPSRNAGSSQATVSQQGLSTSYTLPQFQYLFTDSPSGSGIDGETYQPDGQFHFSIPSTSGDELTLTDSNNNRASISLASIGATPCRIE